MKRNGIKTASYPNSQISKEGIEIAVRKRNLTFRVLAIDLVRSDRDEIEL
jgi:hypothetical protein